MAPCTGGVAVAVAGAAWSPQLTQLTGYLLRRAYVRASTCTRACISEDSQIETAHVREIAIVVILDERGAMSQRELSDITRIDRRLVVGLIDALEERGWVRRERNEADRRSYALRLTAAGREVMVRARTDLARGEQALTGKLSSRQRARLRRHLLALLENDEWLAIDALSQHTGFLIARAHRQVRGWAVEELRPLDIGPRDFGVLAVLGQEQPCSQNHLAKGLGVTPSAALAFVEEL